MTLLNGIAPRRLFYGRICWYSVGPRSPGTSWNTSEVHFGRTKLVICNTGSQLSDHEWANK
jgi:hypothetical protein